MADPKAPDLFNRKAPESVMMAVCETSVALADAIDGGGAVPPKLLQDRLDAMAAYRSATAPLRTRASVDADLCADIREYMRLRYQVDNTTGDQLQPIWARMSELCSEPTRDEPEETHQERHERMNAAGMAKVGEILGRKANALTDHDADLREPEACSCEESEALKSKLADIQTEWDLWIGHKKSDRAALSAIGLLLRGE